MDADVVLNLVMRWTHILAAITAVGGTMFARFVVVPALDPLPGEQRSALHAAMRSRWSKIIAGAIALLLVSGLYNFIVIAGRYDLPRWYHPVFGIKFILAFVVFAIASLLTGRTPLADQMRRSLRFWLNVNISLAVTIVCLSGILRSADKIPKPTKVPQPKAAATLHNRQITHPAPIDRHDVSTNLKR